MASLNRLTIAARDLEGAIRYLNALSINAYGSLEYEALLISAVLFYARPFSSNEKNGSPYLSAARVDEKSMPAALTDEERELHDDLISFRSKAIAPAEWSHHPAGVSDRGVIHARPFPVRRILERARIALWISLTTKVLQAVQHAQADALAAVRRGE